MAHRQNSTVSTTSNEDETQSSSGKRRTRQVMADEMITALAAQIARLQHVIKDAVNIDWSSPDTRLDHLQPLFSLQGKSLNNVCAREQILMTWACMSLAQDFAAYEKKSGWKPKLEILGGRILGGASPAAQAIGKHLQGFLTAHLPEGVNAVKIDTAIRQGTKLIILEHIGKALGFGDGLSFLVGFRSRQLLRLNYNQFPVVMASLRTDSAESRQISAFCAFYSSWWTQSFQHYHRTHGSLLATSNPSADLAAASRPYSSSSYSTPASTTSYNTPATSYAMSAQPYASSSSAASPYATSSVTYSPHYSRPTPVAPAELSRVSWSSTTISVESLYATQMPTQNSSSSHPQAQWTDQDYDMNDWW